MTKVNLAINRKGNGRLDYNDTVMYVRDFHLPCWTRKSDMCPIRTRTCYTSADSSLMCHVPVVDVDAVGCGFCLIHLCELHLSMILQHWILVIGQSIFSLGTID